MTGVDTPVLVYDGDCAFCSSSVRLLERLMRRRPEVIPWQRADLDALGLTATECAAALQWVAPSGERRSGAGAVAATLRHGGRGWRLIGRALDAPGLSRVAARVYAGIARHRHRLPGGTPACAMDPSPDPPVDHSPDHPPDPPIRRST